MKSKTSFSYLLVMFLIANLIYAQGNDKLEITGTKEIGQIEVGSRYVGIEIHKSFPMINRISFYYPVANSIDINEDYWKRANYRIMSMGIKVGNNPKHILENEIYKVTQSPYSVEFYKEKFNSGINIKYEFCMNSPALVATFKIRNNSDSTENYEVYTHCEAVLKTSHTYALMDTASTSIEDAGKVVKVNYDTVETGYAQVFFANAGEKPEYYTSNSFSGKYKNLNEYWLNSDKQFENIEIPESKPGKPAAAFVYKKKLKPGESLEIIQLIGSVKKEESNEKINYLFNNYEKETESYKNYVLNNSVNNKIITTNNKALDFTSDWAEAVLATNQHYLDDAIVPMPAQAQYNFYFTHDVLVTDLAIVNYDLNRVKNDLSFIISHANKDHVIPHAYYWKDTEYKTEFADHDNWNNFWINIVAASYLRGSNDKLFVEKLYPYLTKSVETALLTLGKDSLMWSYRPDWWDIGKLYGSKTYMTALAARTIEDYVFISLALGKNTETLARYEKLAGKLKENMVKILWSDKQNYLMNYYEPGKLDPHYYIGSLVPAYMGMLDKEKTAALLKTAKDKLLDEKVGIYNAYPMDFHTLGNYLKFTGNEAGDVYYYFNGGIWPQGNAWYTLALIQNGQKDEALNFIKNVMTIDGLMKGPNGQPALYEVRNGNKNSPSEYGKVDKPQFMWAGAWYLNCLYNLFGINNNSWNVTLDPYLPAGMENVSFKLNAWGNKTRVTVKGAGDKVQSINFDGKKYPSLVFPSGLKTIDNVEIIMGVVESPVITSTNSILNSAELLEDKLIFNLSAFSGHANHTQIISPREPESIQLNSETNNQLMTFVKSDGVYKINVGFKHNSASEEKVIIKFKR